MEDKTDQTPESAVEITPELLEETRKIVEAEQQDLWDSIHEHEDPDDILKPTEEYIKWDLYFDNWHCRLPGSTLREYSEELGVMDKPAPLDSPNRTDFTRGKTFREQVAVIDKAIDEEGLDRDKIKKLMDAVKDAPAAASGSRIAINKYTSPAYIRMRAQGCNKADITS